ncbi:MAG: hypothetical protein HeimC2_38520 [Candidatus Heimdallarchaeota archaeon LC_2]|nr:MAG: hypothetical protein HeimC2_38520 [Candidatus Heimdallarchaeota archaeon LC_2]
MVNLFVPIQSDETMINMNSIDLDNTYPAKAFGRVKYYALINASTMDTKLIQNSNHHFGGKDHPVDIATRNQTDAILAAHLGSNPYTKFKDKNYTIYQVDISTPLSVLVDRYNRGELKELDTPEAGSCCSGGKNHH